MSQIVSFRHLSLFLLLASCTQQGGEKVSLPEKAIVQEKSSPATTEPTKEALTEQKAVEQLPENQTSPTLNEAATSPAATGNFMARLTGEVSSQRRSNLAFRVQGFVQEIRLRPGNSCKKGDVLAVLDPRDFQLTVELARAQKELARVALQSSKSEFQREEQLRKENASTASAFDKVEAAYERSKIDFEIADLNFRKAMQALGDTKLLAPYDCVVSKQQKYVGENVQSGQAVYEIFDTQDVELRFSVPERMAGQLKVGDKLRVTIPATGFKGVVDIIRLVPVVDETNRTFQIIAKAPEDQRVVPGLYAEAAQP